MAARKFSLSSLLTAALTVWILLLIGKVGYDRWQGYVAQTKVQTRSVAKWHDLIRNRKPALGNDKAHVTIVVFFDSQCPYCQLIEPRLEKLIADHPGEIAVYRYDFPLTSIHPYAMPAAIAADCAALQDAAEPYQSQLFKQASFANFDWTNLAQKIGIHDVNEFSRCLDKRTPADAIGRDITAGKSLNISSTPILVFNGALASGALSDAQLTTLYKRAKSSSN
jgi:protein-disulfide isomerase